MVLTLLPKATAAGSGCTYYKLRDPGAALGFPMDWTAEKGIFLETE